MTKLKSSTLTIVVLSSVFLFGMISSSQAQIEIIDMYTPAETDNNGSLYHFAYIETDRPYDTVYWYIGDPDDENSLQYIGETLGDGCATRAWFYPDASDCPGDIKGEKYTVAAKAWYYNPWTKIGASDFETRDFRVFEAKSIYGIKEEDNWEKPNVTGVYGHVQLTRHYHDGSGIVMEGSVYACNGTEEDCTVRSIFRHTRMDAGGFQKQDPENGPNNELPPSEPLLAGQTYSDSANSSYLRFPVPNGGVIRPDDRYRLNAHVHLEVHGNGTTDVWHETNDAWTHTFTKDDNQ